MTAIGEDVTRFRVGDRVVGQFWSRPLRCGTFAEVRVVQAVPALGALATIPTGMPSHVAAALPTAGMTALGAIEHTQAPEGGTRCTAVDRFRPCYRSAEPGPGPTRTRTRIDDDRPGPGPGQRHRALTEADDHGRWGRQSRAAGAAAFVSSGMVRALMMPSTPCRKVSEMSFGSKRQPAAMAPSRSMTK